MPVTGAVEYALVLLRAGIESLDMARSAVDGLLDSSEGWAFPHAHIHIWLWRGMGHHPLRERFDDLIELPGQARAAAIGPPRPPTVVKVA